MLHRPVTSCTGHKTLFKVDPVKITRVINIAHVTRNSKVLTLHCPHSKRHLHQGYTPKWWIWWSIYPLKVKSEGLFPYAIHRACIVLIIDAIFMPSSLVGNSQACWDLTGGYFMELTICLAQVKHGSLYDKNTDLKVKASKYHMVRR